MYKQKYLKYKQKYLELRNNMKGGTKLDNLGLPRLRQKLENLNLTKNKLRAYGPIPEYISTELIKLEEAIQRVQEARRVEEIDLQRVMIESKQSHNQSVIRRAEEEARREEARREEEPRKLIFDDRNGIGTQDNRGFHEARDIDKVNHIRPVIEKLNEMITSGLKYNLYLSIGGGCGSQYRELEELRNCINTQNKVPEGFHDGNGKLCIIIIDESSNIREVKEYLPTYSDNIFVYKKFWLDDYIPLIEKLREFLEYNRKLVGKTLCINFTKLQKFKSPIFTNLIRSFYPEDANDNTFSHFEIINRNRAMYLDWTYWPIDVEDNSKASLVLYNHSSNETSKRDEDFISHLRGSGMVELKLVSELSKGYQVDKVFFSSNEINFDI